MAEYAFGSTMHYDEDVNLLVPRATVADDPEVTFEPNLGSYDSFGAKLRAQVPSSGYGPSHSHHTSASAVEYEDNRPSQASATWAKYKSRNDSTRAASSPRTARRVINEASHSSSARLVRRSPRPDAHDPAQPSSSSANSPPRMASAANHHANGASSTSSVLLSRGRASSNITLPSLGRKLPAEPSRGRRCLPKSPGAAPTRSTGDRYQAVRERKARMEAQAKANAESMMKAKMARLDQAAESRRDLLEQGRIRRQAELRAVRLKVAHEKQRTEERTQHAREDFRRRHEEQEQAIEQAKQLDRDAKTAAAKQANQRVDERKLQVKQRVRQQTKAWLASPASERLRQDVTPNSTPTPSRMAFGSRSESFDRLRTPTLSRGSTPVRSRSSSRTRISAFTSANRSKTSASSSTTSTPPRSTATLRRQASGLPQPKSANQSASVRGRSPKITSPTKAPPKVITLGAFCQGSVTAAASVL